jgi:4-hydroxy-tetrahydrodipicolinate synthase
MKLIHGIIPPMVTPFDDAGGIQERSLRANVRYLIEQGVHGVAVCGSTGEGHTLTLEEARNITAITVEEAAGRIPVVAGIITNSTQSAIERARSIADLGVAALQVTPVHYVFRPDDEAMIRHFSAIANASGIPVIIYNVVPWSYLSPSLLTRILRMDDGVIGVKQSASDMKALADLLLFVEEAGIADRAVILSAVDALLYSSFSLGADGAVAAILSAVPDWCVALWEAVRSGDHDTARALHRDLLRVWNAIDAPNLPANVKTAMRLRGREGGVPRAPMPPSSPEQVERIRQAVEAARTAPAVLA